MWVGECGRVGGCGREAATLGDVMLVLINAPVDEWTAGDDTPPLTANEITPGDAGVRLCQLCVCVLRYLEKDKVQFGLFCCFEGCSAQSSMESSFTSQKKHTHNQTRYHIITFKSSVTQPMLLT